MEKNLEISTLIDFYGNTLNPRKRDIIESYYNDDLSLSEIAMNYDMTRQGVRDIIKRVEIQLLSLEENLQLLNKFNKMQKVFEDIDDQINQIRDINNKKIFSAEIDKCISNISIEINKIDL